MQEVTSGTHLEHTQACYCFFSSAWKLVILYNSNNPSSIANTLNSHFTSVGSSTFNRDHPPPPTSSLPHPTPTLSLDPATPEWCENALAALKPNCATGPTNYLLLPLLLAMLSSPIHCVLISTLPLLVQCSRPVGSVPLASLFTKVEAVPHPQATVACGTWQM